MVVQCAYRSGLVRVNGTDIITEAVCVLEGRVDNPKIHFFFALEWSDEIFF